MLTVRGLTAEYARERGSPLRAVDDIGFDVPEGKLFTLLGPSGCGKTTALRAIAGLVTPVRGEISLGGALLHSTSRGMSVPPHRRDIGMVFQSYAIWPHLNVFENVAFPLRATAPRLPRVELERRVRETLQCVELERVGDRPTSELSGGQQQRLALARALVMQPRLLLLDEPLSSLDAKLREKMRFELKRLQRAFRITTVYVTHDQDEALALSHLVAVMDNGRLRQIGTPREVYQRPASRFVAEFVGSANFINGHATAVDDGNAWSVDTEIGRVRVDARDPSRDGEALLLSVRPEHVSLAEARPDGRNVWRGEVRQKVFLGERTDYRVRIGSRILQARAHPSLRTRIGEPVWVRIDPADFVVLSA